MRKFLGFMVYLLTLFISVNAWAANFAPEIKLEQGSSVNQVGNSKFIKVWAERILDYTIDPGEKTTVEGEWSLIKIFQDDVYLMSIKVQSAQGRIGLGYSSITRPVDDDNPNLMEELMAESSAVVMKPKFRVSARFDYAEEGVEDYVFDEELKYDAYIGPESQLSQGHARENIIDPASNGPEIPVNSNSIDPIELSSGNMFIEATDIKIPGFGKGLVFSRMYNSQDDTVGLLGYGWRTNYDYQLEVLEDGAVIETNRSAAVTKYSLNEDNSFSPSIAKFSKLTSEDDGTYTLVRRNGEQQHFNSDGKLSQVVSRTGAKLYLTYDANGNLISVEDQAGRKIEFTIVDDKISQAKEPSGKVTSYFYDDRDNLIKIIDPAANEINYVYDENHNIVEMTNANGNKTFYAYDDQDRAYSNWQEGDVNKETIFYDSDSQTTLIDALGNETVYCFTKNGVTRKIVTVDGGTTEFVYNKDMNKEFIIDPYGSRIEFKYDENKNLSQIIDANGNITEYTYEPIFNKITSVTDVLGNLTSYDYDANGNLLKVIDALGNITEYTYDSFGNRTSIVDANGNITGFEYDQFANLIKKTDALGNQTRISYDESSNPTSIIDSKGNETTNSYDILNRIKEITFSDKTKVEIEFDSFGNKKSITDQLGRIAKYNYDNYERMISTIDALEKSVANSYDKKGNPLSVTDQNGNVTSIRYDFPNNVIFKTTALGNMNGYKYDFLNRIISTIDPNRNIVNYTYNKIGNLTRKSYYPSEKEVTYAYDSLSRLASMTDWTGTTNYSYDSLGRLIEIDGPESADIIKYEYDAVGNKIAMINQDGQRTEYSYDALNRLNSVTDQKGTTTYSYDELSNVIKIEYPNSASIEKAYDNMNRVVSLINKDVAGAIISSFTQEYNSVGNIIKKTLQNGAWIEYRYDEIDRLVQETKKKTKKDGTIKTQYDYQYVYDAAGNRTEFNINLSISKFWNAERPNLAQQVKDELSLAGYGQESIDLPLSFKKIYNYDADNQLNDWTRNISVEDTLININQFAYTYDANGNRTSKNLTKIDIEEPFTTNYTYDMQNRLTNIEYLNRPNENGVTSASFEYNSNGQRLKSTEVRPSKTNTTKYYYDGLNVIIERSEADLSQKTYTRAPNYGGGIAGLINMTKANGNSFYYHYDALGSVTGLTNKNGQSVLNTNYDAYGKKKGMKGKWKGNNYRFSSKEYESHAGLYYFGARYYDPNIGRWLTRDPMGHIDGPNVYAYVSNNPVNYVDPLGLFRFGKRPLNGFSWYDHASDNPLDNKTNTEMSHEHGFFEDGSGDNVGFGKGGRFSEQDMSGYRYEGKHYDDDLMREALKNVKDGRYSLFGFFRPKNNCQDWADRLRDEYYKLENKAGKEKI